jgi:hypothetical protein
LERVAYDLEYPANPISTIFMCACFGNGQIPPISSIKVLDVLGVRCRGWKWVLGTELSDRFNALATLVREILYALASCARLSPRARSRSSPTTSWLE